MTLPLEVTRFLELLAARPRRPNVLALDYDGTLAPFVPERTRAVLAPALVPALRRLASCAATRVLFVSGRPIAELEALVDLEPLPELYGVHGWEQRLPNGTRKDRLLPPAEAATLEAEHARLLAAGLEARVERKSATLALHWRGLEPAEAARLQRDVGGRWAQLAGASDLELRAFNGGLELRHSGRDKGDVLAELAAADSEALIAYLGDDDTDEDAFRVLRDLDSRTLPLLVADAERPTAARARIEHSAVREFLEGWLAAVEGAP